MKTSICVPCKASSHLKNINELLDAYDKQTIKPDEIVISFSEWNNQTIPDKTNENIPIKCITDVNAQFAGINRNKAAQHSTGDILIYNDADDIPSTQRVEIIKHVFNSDKDIQMVVHNYAWDHIRSNDKLTIYEDVDTFLNKSKIDSLDNIIVIPLLDPYSWEHTFANGPVSIRREIFNHVKWSNKMKGQDADFVKEAHHYCKNNNLKSVIIKNVIYYYRNNFSSW